MACRCAPALVVLRDQVNAAYPDRDRLSDGCCASAAHSQENPTSDHEPGSDGFAAAYDLDLDLVPGAGPGPMLALREHLYETADSRLKYLIFRGEIWYPHNGVRPRGKYAYTGVNAHAHHMHVSIFRSAVLAIRPWSITEEEDVTKDEFKAWFAEAMQTVPLAFADGKRPLTVHLDEMHERQERQGADLFKLKQAAGVDQ
jgi:hypothetical protein